MQELIVPVLLVGVLPEKPEANEAGEDPWEVGHHDVGISESKPVEGPGGRGQEGGNGE